MRSLPLLISVMWFALCSSCRNEKGDQLGITPTEEISGNISIWMQPPGKFHGNPQPAPFTLVCTTEKHYPCANYGIDYTMERNGQVLEIQFNNIEKHTVCLASFGPANCNIPLDGLAGGSYKLNLLLNGKTNSYMLEVSDESYKIIPEDNGSSISFGVKEVMVIPPNTLWGQIWDHSGDDITPFFEQFNTAMTNNGATLKTLSPGNYWIFSVDNNGEMVISPGSSGRGYFYQYNGNINDLKPVVEQFADSVTVRLQNKDGVLVTN